MRSFYGSLENMLFHPEACLGNTFGFRIGYMLLDIVIFCP